MRQFLDGDVADRQEFHIAMLEAERFIRKRDDDLVVFLLDLEMRRPRGDEQGFVQDVAQRP